MVWYVNVSARGLVCSRIAQPKPRCVRIQQATFFYVVAARIAAAPAAAA